MGDVFNAAKLNFKAMKDISALEWITHLSVVTLGLIILNYPAFDLTFGVFDSGDLTLLWPSIVGTGFNLTLYYGIAFVLIPRTLKRGVGVFVIRLVALFILVSAVEVFVDSLFYMKQSLPLDNMVWFEIIAMVVFMHIISVIMAFAYRFTKDWFTNEQLRRSVTERQLKSELEILKRQINPHFLFNALNNLFSMALQSGDEPTAEGIGKLSEMMRYVFDKTGEDRVALQDEIRYISDYIYLQQLRFSEQVTVSFTYPEETRPFSIAPMLLIPFVENAFKYGVSAHARTEITIQLKWEADRLQFEVRNQKAERTETIPSSGVGLDNVKKRLELVYPDKHELTVDDGVTHFNVRLTILNL